jgi:hypothetical protein
VGNLDGCPLGRGTNGGIEQFDGGPGDPAVAQQLRGAVGLIVEERVFAVANGLRVVLEGEDSHP